MPQHRTSPTPPGRQVFGGSSISADSGTVRKNSPRICVAVMRWATFSDRLGVPVVEFRASVVIGSGSLSFEMIRALVERLPVMIAPRWVSVAAQPIAIADLISYLLAALDLPLDGNKIFEIGGSDQVSYGGLMKEYATQRGLKRLVISVPFLTPRLSSLWLGLVTPLYVRVGRKLIDSICHATIVEDQTALAFFKIRPRGFREAIAEALKSDGRHHDRFPDDPRDRFSEMLSLRFAGSAARKAGTTRTGCGNSRVAGQALRRGGLRWGAVIRILFALATPSTFGVWRPMEPDHVCCLAAEMKLPGQAWLEFEVTGDATGSVIRQTATFDPEGLLGRAYWYSVFPCTSSFLGECFRASQPRAESTAERMPTFLKSVIVEAPVEIVFGFHERQDALRLLSPSFPPVRVLRKTGGIEPGSRVELKLGPFLWTALHTAYVKNRLFADEQIQGPFAKWVHRHEFEAVGECYALNGLHRISTPRRREGEPSVWMVRAARPASNVSPPP